MLPPLDHKIKVFIADDSLIVQEPDLTNYPYPAYRQKCLQAGADFFLDKSTEFDQIPELIAQHKEISRK